ncbi:Ku protein [Haliangium ochraceum]|uniref:Non-homologous end joining protein Ku n=1 Tax=Haliangium ochraceum (strain DSM 14365 / JCM 11303 / SMP-2) TaxID=502025 RepID=D0LUZ0_HALO1|nr:Ku protein [Haliangium ochraceum]ACY15831.1 Ku protein [Haliangium ochraceum DSM 14365]
MAARAHGSATLSFGLVSIPVKVYSSHQTGSQLSFHFIHDACGTRLKQQYICPTHDEVVPRADIAKGYEYAKGKHVQLTREEIKALEAVSDDAIALAEFVPADTVDPVYFDKAYYLGPAKGGNRAYHLLGQAMRDTGLVGIARYAARGRENVVMVRPHQEAGLVMHQLRYPDEVRTWDQIPIDEAPAIDERELDLAKRLIDQIASERFEPERYRDQVKERVLALIEEKLAGREIEVAAPTPRGEIIDLMEALKASLGAADADAEPARMPAKTAPRKTATRRKAAKSS